MWPDRRSPGRWDQEVFSPLLVQISQWVENYLASEAAKRLLPLLARFAEKKLEHPPDSLRISLDHFEMVKGRSNKKFEHPLFNKKLSEIEIK